MMLRIRPALRVLQIATAATALVFAAHTVATAAKPDNCKGKPVPAALQPPGAPPVLARMQSEGKQIFRCRADKGGFAWAHVGAAGDLTDAAGKPLGTRVAGPGWRATDGSVVVAKVVASAPDRDGKNMPWQLLKATAHKGIGRFARVTYIQRINTEGGTAPKTGCDAAHVGSKQRVRSFAVYMLFH